MRELGGRVEFLSSPSRGTLLRCEIPGPQGGDHLKIRILVADDHDIVRAGLKSLLERQEDIEIVGEAADGRELWCEWPRNSLHPSSGVF